MSLSVSFWFGEPRIAYLTRVKLEYGGRSFGSQSVRECRPGPLDGPDSGDGLRLVRELCWLLLSELVSVEMDCATFC